MMGQTQRLHFGCSLPGDEYMQFDDIIDDLGSSHGQDEEGAW
jgi:hypothetical protein